MPLFLCYTLGKFERMSTYYNKKEKTSQQKADIENKLELCIESFKSVLYERDETFLENMAKSNMDQGNLARYMLWEWTQGVGLYGLWKLFEKKHDQRCLDVLTEYYDARIAEGLPSKNINTDGPHFCPELPVRVHQE